MMYIVIYWQMLICIEAMQMSSQKFKINTADENTYSRYGPSIDGALSVLHSFAWFQVFDPRKRQNRLESDKYLSGA